MESDNMIIVGVDARLAVERGRGWGRYATEFLKQISKRKELRIKALLPDTEVGRILSSQLVDAESIFHPPFELNADDDFLLKSMASIELCEVFDSIDIFHSLTRFVAYTNFHPTIATVHDIAPLSEPPFKLSYLKATRESLSTINQQQIPLIAISEFTKDELVKYGEIESVRVKVIYQGVEFPPKNEFKFEKSLNGSFKLLYVGGAGENRNIDSLINCAKLLSKEMEIELNLVGDLQWDYKQYKEKFNKSENHRLSIIFHDLVSDKFLSELYSSADMFVFPTLHEGFGIPIVEAMLHQLPVCCSDIPIMREVAADAALYFSPNNPESMARTIKPVLLDKTLRGRLIKAGQLRSQKFTWQDSISETIQFYREVINNHQKTIN